MNCETWQDKLDAFVDGELSPVQATALEEHLRACPACSAETRARQQLKRETHFAGQAFPVPPALEAKLRGQFAPARRRWMVTPALAGAAAALVIAVITGTLLWRQSVQQQLVAQLVDQHVATLASTNPVDVVSTDSHTVKPWFAGKVPFSVDVPKLEGTPYTLVGGRVAYFQQAPAAQLIFAVRQHRISVFIFRDHGETSLLGADRGPVRRMGFNSQTWVEDGIRYFAVSDVNGEDVRRLCDLLKDASES
jgi:anti-sigma factor RsiW